MQLDTGERGFSFMKEGPLDMRMDPTLEVTAADIVNGYREKELGELFRDLGEERHWKKAASAIVEARRKKKIMTTTDLEEILFKTFGRRGRLHPATLVFQALRIAVNKELESIETALKKAISLLNPCGRIGAISFHSLEDRIVKNQFKAGVASSELQLVYKKPLVPTRLEMRKNSRARSAKMRFAEKYETT